MSLVSRRSLARSGLLLALLFGVFVIRMPASQGACAAPITSVELERAEPGQTVTVKGEYWGTECNDTRTCPSGCGAGCPDFEPTPPARDISIVLVPRGQTPGQRTVLAEGIEADDRLEFTDRSAE